MVCKLVKKTVLASAAVVGGLALVNGFWSGSVSTAFNRIGVAFHRHVSPEFELERIDHEIAQLTPDLRKHIEKIAYEKVEVEKLERDATAMTANLQRKKAETLALADRIASGTVKVRIGEDDPKRKLDREFKAYKTLERSVDNNQKLLAAKKSALESATLQLTEIKSQQQELQALREQLKAEWEALKVEQARSTVKLDDSRLGAIKASLEKVRQRIDVEKHKVDLTAQFVPADKADKATDGKDLVTQVRDHLNADKSQAVQD